MPVAILGMAFALLTLAFVPPLLAAPDARLSDAAERLADARRWPTWPAATLLAGVVAAARRGFP